MMSRERGCVLLERGQRCQWVVLIEAAYKAFGLFYAWTCEDAAPNLDPETILLK